MSGDVAAAIERLQERLPLWRLRGWEAAEVGVEEIAALLTEVERLRAEREALHSDKTRERLTRHLAAVDLMGIFEWEEVNENGHAMYREQADAVLSVLSAGSEAAR